MGVNQFLAFGTGGGANVIDQVTYSGLAARTSGFSSGTAQSAQLNKVWRQSSIIAAMIGQMIADYSGSDANDDGDIPTLESRMIAGMRGALQSSISGVVGQSRNLNMNVSSASTTATLTADEIVVETALGGVRYCLGNFNQSINLATTGAGGMDTGSAPTSGYVAIYAIYNPTGNARALLAVNASSAAAPSIYGGSNMPAGYTASALVSVWPTSGGLLGLANQTDREVQTQGVSGLNTTTQYGSYTSIAVGNAVPFNAKSMAGTMLIGSAGASGGSMSIASTANGLGSISYGLSGVSSGSGPFRLMLQAARTIFIANSSGQSGATFGISIASYTF